jgi:hypothetical protein
MNFRMPKIASLRILGICVLLVIVYIEHCIFSINNFICNTKFLYVNLQDIIGKRLVWPFLKTWQMAAEAARLG